MSFADAQIRFAERLENLRDETGLTIKEFCERCGISHFTYHYYTKRGGMPNLYTAMVIADTFGLTLDQLMGINGGKR